MQFNIEKNISNFIKNQFPQFYEEEGENFILFTKAYYEYLESSGNPIGESRNLLNYRDIDNTLESFLEHFQTKYLYGIPFDIIVNKRFLLKHILDVYRSKGTIQCYKLLFKLIYNQDVEIYLPSEDILRPSDGTWIEPRYLEITDNGILNTYVGKNVKGLSSGTTALIENLSNSPINQGIVSIFGISNILPKGGSFLQGEKLIIENQDLSEEIINAPTILGSLDYLKIINGGQDFQVGEILKIAHIDLDNQEIISSGINGKIRVTEVSRYQGALTFNIIDGGFGYTSNTHTFVYNGNGDTTGLGGSFSVGDLSYVKNIEYNTDLLCDYADLPLNSTAFGFPKSPSGNVSSTLSTLLSFSNTKFGTIASLKNITTGNNYTTTPYVFTRSTINSNTLPGTISISNSSNIITGSNTQFTRYFSNNDVIALQANNTTIDYQVIKNVTNNISITLYGNSNYSNTTAKFRVSSVILPSNYALYETVMNNSNNSINGKNENISALPSVGNNVVSNTIAISSGMGYIDGEIVKAYRYNSLETPVIISSGIGYSNNDNIIFMGGDFNTSANGYVTTNSNGNITACVLRYVGSGYKTLPKISINSLNGNGAVLETSIIEYGSTSYITGEIIKTGVGKDIGYWSSTKGFLNSDKYIQDSYFYQDYSYQIKTASTLNYYKDILYKTFHSTGSELFGQFYQIINESSNVSILYESNSAILG